MDVASGDGKETPTSDITTTNESTNTPPKETAATETPSSSGSDNQSARKDDVGSSSSSKSNVSSSASDVSRPSTDSITTTTGQSDIHASLSRIELAATTAPTTTKTPPTTVAETKLNDEEPQQVELKRIEIQKIELNEKSEENLATASAVVVGAPLARSSPISREYLALQKSLNESKILSEFVTDTLAIKAARKGRKSVVSSSPSTRDSPLNKGATAVNRARNLDPLDISNEDQQRAVGKRNMRSQNSEFAQKHMEFLNRVISQQQSGDEQYGSEADEVERYTSTNNDEDDDQSAANVSNSGVIAFDLADIGSLEARLKGVWQSPPKRGWDSFCWRCRECSAGTQVPCSKCPRSFHKHCIKMSSYTKFDSSWLCPECLAVENALNSPKKNRRPDLSLDMLSELLTFALKRMRTSKGSGKFLFAEGDYSYLSKYVVNPVTFTTLEEQITKKSFRCPEEFYNETKWMVHNAHIITTGFSNHKLLVTAKSVVKICRQETNEIETCAGCYLSANTRSDWFVDVCAQPHILLWAKLKGFPYWPAKAMGIGPNSVVNVRFFGKHDRAFVPIKDCYLYSRQDPNMQTGKRSQRELADCIKEVEEHIKNVETKIGKFNYAPLRTPYDPSDELQQLEQMMPGVSQYAKRQAQAQVLKPSLQYKIVKTAGNHLSIIRKCGDETGNEDSEMEIAESKKESKTNAVGNANGGNEAPTKLTISTKYEVITKTTADNDNDSTPKVTAVILKKRRRTNNQNDLEKLEKEECATVPKLLKAQSDPLSLIGGSKRKQQSPGEVSDSGSEKQRAKHVRTEPRLPILTIKTGCGAKLVEHASAREVVEHLSKTNSGVTIKKVNKALPEQAAVVETSLVAETTSRATRSSAKEAATKMTPVNANENQTAQVATAMPTTDKTIAAAATQQITPTTTKNANEKKSAAEKAEERRNIFRELVPFVEVKREVCSDGEEVAEDAATTTTAIRATKTASEDPKKTATSTTATKDVNADTLLTAIKAEVMSDEDADAAITNANETAKAAKSNDGQEAGIRVVGDTIIQRLSAKQTATVNAQQQQATTRNAATSPPTGGGGKRVNTRSGGVPFGPFPATAATSSSLSLTGSGVGTTNAPNETTMSNEITTQSQQLVGGQRARKTFPNRSPPRMMATIPITAAQCLIATGSPPTLSPNHTATNTNGNQNNSGKQNNMLKSTSMVSIPADIAAQRNITQMPPLTAVSKTMPVTAAATSTMAGVARVGSVTSAAFASANNNGNGNAFTPPTKLSAPPPLAGLSTFATVSQLQQQQLQHHQQQSTSNVANVSTTNNGTNTVTDLANSSATSSTDNHLLGDFVTPALANAITEVICRGPPRMAPRPNGPLQSDGSTMFPSEAGPVCRTLVQNAHKLTDFFISVMEDTMCEMSNNEEPSLQAKITLLTIELERMKQAHEQEIAELKRTSDLMLCEMRKSMENEKTRIANEIRKQCELERLRCVEEAKRKQWCANCGREAQFYCCWNTSYCDYPCQQQHWSRHATSCAQTRSNSEAGAGGVGASGLQPVITAANSINPMAINSDGRNKNSTTTVNVHYNNKSVAANTKKDKANTSTISKSTVNVAPVVGGISPDMLKLPSNTSLRAVGHSNVGNTQTRATATATQQQQQPQQPQRFNISLPISSSSSVNPRAPYTIVQRGNSWELMTPPTTNTMTSMSAAINTVAVPPQQQATLTQQQQQRPSTNLNMNRTRGGVSIMSYSATTNGNMRSTQM